MVKVCLEVVVRSISETRKLPILAIEGRKHQS
jgi:hypothetical protein